MKRRVLRANRRAYLAGAATCAFACASAPGIDFVSLARAQAWPAKPVRLVVPFPPGGATDVLARQIGQRLGDAWGQPVVVENRGGASGAIATEYVAKQPADGYALLFATASTHAINPAVSRVAFDPIKDFAPIVNVAAAPLGLVVHPSLPVKSVRELITLLGARPGQLDMASFGTGTGSHLAGELFKSMAKVDMVHVPSKGGAAAITDLLGGHVSLLFDTLSNTLAHAKSGKLRLLASTGPKRVGTMQDLPTVAETLPGYEAMTWFGVLAPSGTARSVVTRVNADVGKVLQGTEISGSLAAQGFEPVGGTPEAFAAQIQRDLAKWAKLVVDAKIRVE
ncbi:MAG: tripartite tricarboxylate transporter substrate binding protein [Proteobacteria bacterium]|nr:tripartite tricarboxylate transporter substrate binding protein [Burkholderiales bacterium]